MTSSLATTSRSASTAVGTTSAAPLCTAASTRAESRPEQPVAEGDKSGLLVDRFDGVFVDVDDFVRVLRHARDAPKFGLVDDLVRRRPVPRFGRDIDAPDDHELVVDDRAVLARAFGHDRTLSPQAGGIWAGVTGGRSGYPSRAAGSRPCP